MKLGIIAVCFAFMFAVPAIAGVEFTKTGPEAPPVEFFHGGGGGP